MADAREHAATVLSAILPARKDLLDRALTRLTVEHFPDRVQQTLFKMLERYADHTGTVLPLKHLEDILRGRTAAGQAELLTETYTLYAETAVTDAEFSWSVEQLRDLLAEKATGEAITEAMEILRTGKTDEKSGETRQGHEAAREALLASLSVIEREVTQQEAPEGSLRHEAEEMLADYAERKRLAETGEAMGVQFGVSALDDRVVGGMQNGDLVLVVGYSSDGKTSFCVQTAWSAAVEQGKNVAFLTTETLRPQVRRRLVARHSTMEMFGLTSGLNTRDLKAGSLSDHDEQVMRAVVDDLTTNPAYGQIYIAQVPRGATLDNIEQRMYRIHRQMNIDLVILDYLGLLSAGRYRQATREEEKAKVIEAKQIATTFDGGRGVPFVTPWQVNRAAREQAEKVGQYSLNATAETAEATNSADLMIALMAPMDNTNRHTEITGQILKQRDGETVNGLVIAVDYATSKFTARGGLQFAAAPNGPAVANLGLGSGLDALIAG